MPLEHLRRHIDHWQPDGAEMYWAVALVTVAGCVLINATDTENRCVRFRSICKSLRPTRHGEGSLARKWGCRTNTLQLTAGDLCTQYWIRRIEFWSAGRQQAWRGALLDWRHFSFKFRSRECCYDQITNVSRRSKREANPFAKEKVARVSL